MPKGYRCVLIALVGSLSLASAPDSRANPKQPKTEANQVIAAQPTRPPPQALERVQPPELYRPCSGGEKDRNSDLCAQWEAVKAAREVADWTYWGIWLGIVGMLGLFGTLFYTRQAVKVAQAATQDADTALAIAARNADAASDHVQIARDTAYRELRAYLSIESVPIRFVGAGTIGGDLIIKNAGKTPAEICVFLTGWIGDFPDTNPSATEPAPYRIWQHKRFINSGSEETVQWFYPLNTEAPQEIASVVANSQARGFYFYGRVEFLDYTRRQRVLHFAFRNNGTVAIGAPFPMVPCPLGNHYEDRGQLA